MCGIGGYVAATKLDGEKMINSLQHRGPDDVGFYETQVGSKQVFIGNRRLRIVDLSENGKQPMISDDGQVVLSFNGEIYNFNLLRQRYFRDHRFHSGTDTEVILKMYQLFGIEALKQLNGDFAIAIYDARLQRLYLAKDRAGVKPLYYYHQNGKFLFGSEIKSLIASGTNFELNEDLLSTYFVFKYVPGNDTLFKHVYRLDKASYLEYDIASDTMKMDSYWEPAYNKGLSNIGYNDARSYCYHLLEEACQMRLMGDVPVGNFLSGGIDSTIIGWFTRQQPGFHHYCASKSDDDLKQEGSTSDYYYAKRVANDWHIDLAEIPIGNDELTLDMIRSTLIYSDDLIADSAHIPAYLISQTAKDQSKVIMTGLGADELFFGYSDHQITLIADYLDKLPHFFAKWMAKRLAALYPGRGLFKPYKRYLSKLGKYYPYPKFKYGLFSIVGDYESSLSVCVQGRERVEQLIASYFTADDPYKSLQHFEFDNFLVKNLNYLDRMTMANSIECRVPFLDHRLIELAFNIPRSYKLSPYGTPKRLLKDAFKPYLPSYVLNRRKAGFNMPIRSIFFSREKIEQLLDTEFFHNFNYFSPAGISTVIKDHISGKVDNAAIIYALVSFQEWYKMYIGK